MTNTILPNTDGTRRMDYRDLTIEAFADAERTLLDRVESLEADNDILRELISAALESLYGKTAECDRLRARYHDALDQLKALRLSGSMAARRAA